MGSYLEDYGSKMLEVSFQVIGASDSNSSSITGKLNHLQFLDWSILFVNLISLLPRPITAFQRDEGFGVRQ